jgi:hypothetical protein
MYVTPCLWPSGISCLVLRCFWYTRKWHFRQTRHLSQLICWWHCVSWTASESPCRKFGNAHDFWSNSLQNGEFALTQTRQQQYSSPSLHIGVGVYLNSHYSTIQSLREGKWSILELLLDWKLLCNEHRSNGTNKTSPRTPQWHHRTSATHEIHWASCLLWVGSIGLHTQNQNQKNSLCYETDV